MPSLPSYSRFPRWDHSFRLSGGPDSDPASRLTLARKIAAITLTLWKKGEDFDINKLNSQAA
jgi:hypothetical protein